MLKKTMPTAALITAVAATLKKTAGFCMKVLYQTRVCLTDLWLDTSTNGLKQVYTSTEAIK
jgi:hypothetical protein